MHVVLENHKLYECGYKMYDFIPSLRLRETACLPIQVLIGYHGVSCI